MGKAMIPIRAIADLVVDEIGDNTGTKRFRILQYIALGFQKMHLFLNQDISVKSIVIKPGQLTYCMPKDFIYETKVGLKRGDRIVTLRMNTDLRQSYIKKDDSETMEEVESVLEGALELNDDCYFYNVHFDREYYSCLRSCGTGYKGTNYYNIDKTTGNVILQLSTFLPEDEIIIEYKSDGLSAGLKLVPSEAFLALYYYGRARYFNEGPNGENEVLWESEYNSLKRLYNNKTINAFAEIFKPS